MTTPTSPRRQFVTRKMFWRVVAALVFMFSLTTFAVWHLEHGQAHKSDQRNDQLCAVISQLRADLIVLELRSALGCPRRMPQKPAATASAHPNAPAARPAAPPRGSSAP